MKWEPLLLNMISLVFAVGALGIALWVIINGQARAQGLDGLFLVLVCVTITWAFSRVPIRTLRNGSWRDWFGR